MSNDARRTVASAALLVVCSLLVCAEGLSVEDWMGSRDRDRGSEGGDALAKIRPVWWKESSELDQVNTPSLKQDIYTSFNPKRPANGYPWRQDLYKPGVYGKCVHCYYSSTNGPSDTNLPSEAGESAPAAAENASPLNAKSIPFPLPAPWIVPVPKGTISFRQLRVFEARAAASPSPSSSSAPSPGPREEQHSAPEAEAAFVEPELIAREDTEDESMR